MAPRSDTTLLWLCLVSLGVFAFRRLARNLHEVPKLTQVRRDEGDERMISQGTEDALKLETLEKLTESPSYELRGASLRIISERATKEASRDLLLEDLASKNKRRRDRALTAMHFLVCSRAARSASTQNLHNKATMTALVDCLVNFLSEHTTETGIINSPILPKTRPQGEKKALAVLNVLLADNAPAALEAGVITRWLAEYPFPVLRDGYIDDGTEKKQYQRKDVVRLVKKYWWDDTLMSSIFMTLLCERGGPRQFRSVGLLGELHSRDNTDADEEGEEDGDVQDNADSDVWMVNGSDTAGRSTGQPLQDVDEQTLRRRRREAMVFTDGGPLGEENIVQRLPTW